MSDAKIGSAAEPIEFPADRQMTRRTFVQSAAIVTCAGAALPAFAAHGIARGGAHAAAARKRTAVVGFHVDWPYLDPTGTAEPYHPSAGVRHEYDADDLARSLYLGQFGY